MKTNAVRILESLSIEFVLRDYDVDPEDLSATTVAKKVGLPLTQVYKTLVCRGDRGGVMFAVIAGECELDLKTLARASNDRKCQMVALKEVQPLTGYVRGGVTVLGARKAFPAYVDQAMLEHEQICVSAGVRGTQVLLSPREYLRATQAKLVEQLGRSV
jgi:Cys-tRNA(Pro)/Cys-tRNA(Cys) deacylase